MLGDLTSTVRPKPTAARRRPRRGQPPAAGVTATDRVGDFELRIILADESPESRRRWEQRSEALAAWLLSRWREERGQEGRN